MQQVLELLELEIPHLRRYARFLVRDIDLADDLVQECLLRAVANAERWRPGTNLRAWLFVILKNAFISERRQAARRSATMISVSAEDRVEASVPAGQESYMELIEVHTAYRELSAEHREVLMLVAAEGLSYEEAAEILEVPVGTIRSRLSRARTALRQQLETARGATAGEVESG